MRTLAPVLALLVALAPAACGGDAAEETAETAADAMRQAADAMQEAAENFSSRDGDSDAEPVTAEAMQQRLPEELGGMERTSSERQSMGAAGMNMASATATYEGDGKSLEVSLMSGGGIMMGPAMAFAMVDFDRTTDTGYERTVRLHGYKGMQSYEEEGDYRRAEITLLVDDRVLIRLEGEGMTMEELEEVLDDLDPDSIG